MRGSRLVMVIGAALALALAAPAGAFAYTLYGASGETTANAYGNYYAGQSKCAGAMCHANIASQKTVHNSFVTDVKANPSALIPAADDSAFWPTPFSGITLKPSDIYLRLGDNIGFLEYAGAADSTLGVPNPSDDLRLWNGAQYTIGASAWDSSTKVSASAYSQSCSGCHNLGVTRPSNATYTLPSGATQSTSTPSGAWGMGIQCEVCHGSGKNPGAHAPGVPTVVAGTQILKAQVCGQCHGTGTTTQKNVAGNAFGNANGYTTDATLSAYITMNTTVPTEAQFMSYITSGGAKPAFLPNGDDYSVRHVYYNEWLNNLVPSSHGGSYGHANPTNSSVANGTNPKCLGCHSGLGFLNRIEATKPTGSLLVTDAPTIAQVKASDPGISCQICHDGHVGYNATQTGYDSQRKWGNGKTVECGDCHNWQFEVLDQQVQTEVISGKRYARQPANLRATHPQREMFSGGEGGANGTGGMWGVAPMGEFMPGQKCQDCHMPRTHKEGMPANDDGSNVGTRMSHRFHVTEPGDAQRWKLRAGGDSCSQQGCHTGSAADYTRADFQQWIDTVQSGTVAHINETTASLAAVSADLGMAGKYSDFVASQPATVTEPSAAEWEMLQKAAQNVGFVNSDSSKGVHQPQYAAAGLQVASMWARSYRASITATEAARTDGGDGVKITGTLLGNDGLSLVGSTVVLEASTDGGATWTAVASKKMTGVAFTFLTGGVLGETQFRASYTPDADVAYRSSAITVEVPFTTLSLLPSAAASGWVDAPVQVTLASPGADSITFYTLSGATVQAATVYSGPFSVSANGETDVTYWSTSAQGAEVAHVQPIQIDRAVPTVSANAGSLYVDSARVDLSAHDAFSGPKYLEYSLDGGAWAKADGAVASVNVTSLGTHTLRARATNNLGHTGPIAGWAFSVKRATWVAPSPSSSKITIRRGTTWTYRATLRARDGHPVAGKTIVLQRSYNGTSWTSVATRTTSSAGTASRAAKMSSRGTTYWRWYVPGNGSYLPAAGPRTKLVVK